MHTLQFVDFCTFFLRVSKKSSTFTAPYRAASLTCARVKLKENIKATKR